MRGSSPSRTRFRRHLRREETDAERRLWSRLRDRRLAGFKFVRQEQIGPYIVDFVCREARLVIEADGSQHAENARDHVRDSWLAERGYRILRFWNSDIMQQTDSIVATILVALPPSPRLRGEDAEPLVGFGVSPKGEGEGGLPSETPPESPPHPRLPPRFADDKVDKALSPQAGRGGERA
ncbi:MAG: DUF559 domain-containing protein [Methylobacterium sp.]|uniref:endonuclease domain-containing protein n=1 Tax=unclassified Methylobacterium TaxID=2615210 RepID=UPI0009EC2476|nr:MULTISPECIES: DUF559 domain-containing protein [unclassified Methylobacterium]MDO9428783.1 DUF559 domain-containing protein [Methylobacterium sp.]TXM67028.1 endonuclease domain-containing protein [Methylobacterium sp. WL69]